MAVDVGSKPAQAIANRIHSVVWVKNLIFAKRPAKEPTRFLDIGESAVRSGWSH